MTSKDIDVAVIGGGPAGISACLELAKSSDLNIVLFENDAKLGGMPRSCHIFFGMRDLRRIYTGPKYAQKLNDLVRNTSTIIKTETHVSNIRVGHHGNSHHIEVLTPHGFQSFSAKFIILAMGCSEMSAGARQIPSQRPAGIYTTGALQQIANIYHQKPGKRAIIIGSEPIAHSSLITLRSAGVDIAGMVEEDSALKTYQLPTNFMRLYYRFPIYRDTTVKTILGAERVEGVELVNNREKKAFTVDCDTVIITGKFHPDSQLIDDTPILRDPQSQGPLVNMHYMTSVPNIYAAGNILRGANMHDLCALEGKVVAHNILDKVKSSPNSASEEGIQIQVEAPIRYVVPQKIAPIKSKSHFFPFLRPGYSVQLDHTVVAPVIEAWSGDAMLWRKSYKKLLGHNRILLPVNHFNWSRLDSKSGIKLRLQQPKQ